MVTPQQNTEGVYKLGIWIRDNAQGVGTMTYLDEKNGFGALGHGINDTDTADLMEVQSGSLYKTKIVNIRKGISGTPGELTGVIDYKKENRIGVISINSVEGIFGTLSQEEADTAGWIETGSKKRRSTDPELPGGGRSAAALYDRNQSPSPGSRQHQPRNRNPGNR